MLLKFKKLQESAVPPAYSRAGDAAMDIYALEELDLAPQTRALVHTGIAIEIEEGWCGLVLPRSGNAINYGVTVMNAPGLIDSNYRGEIMVGLINTDTKEKFSIKKGDRIAQLLITKSLVASEIEIKEEDELSESNRGEQGFGSSGR